MVNKELLNNYIDNLNIHQLKDIVNAFIQHYELTEEYYLDTIINNIVKIAKKSSKIADKKIDVNVLKENQTLFTSSNSKVIEDSIKIIGYDIIMNNVKIEYTLEGNKYPYTANIDIDSIKS